MFGADGDRLSALREQQKAQYLADLQQQIEEKTRRSHSPSPYSTTTRDATSLHQYSNTNTGYLQQTNFSPNAIQNANINPNRSLDFNLTSNTNINRNLSNLRQSNRIITHQQTPEYTPTSVAPINIQVNSINSISKYSALLPAKINSSKTLDVSKFNQRINEIENLSLIHKESLSNFFENESIIMQKFQNMQNLMLQIQSSINEITSSRIPLKTSNLLKSIKDIKEIITSDNLTFERECNNIREKFSKESNSFTAFSGKFNEFSENIKQQLLNIKSDNYRQNKNIEKLGNKIATAEQKESQIESKVQTKNDEFISFDSDLAQKFTNFNSNVSSLMSEYSKVLANEIRKESQYRTMVNQKLFEQTVLLSQRVQSSINHVLEKNHELSNSFKESLESLKSSIISSANEMQNEINSLQEDQNNQINQIISDTETGFRSIQDSILSTTNDLRDFSKKTFNLLEETLQLENSNRKQNKNEILSKFDHFENAIKDELQIQKNAIKDTFNKLKNDEISEANDLLNPLKTETSIMKSYVDNIDKYEEDLQRIESEVFLFNKQTLKSVEKLDDNFSIVKNQLDLDRSEINIKFSEIERRISELEHKRESNDYIIIDDVFRINQKFENDEELKIIELEKQIDVALHALANLMGGRKPSLYTTIDQMRIDSDTESSNIFTNTEEEDIKNETKDIIKAKEKKIEEEEEEEEKEKIEEEEEEEKEKIEEEEEVNEEEDSENKKKVLPITIHVSDVDNGNIGKLDTPNEAENQEMIKNLAFNPNDFGFTLPERKKNDKKDNNEKQSKEEEEEEEEEEDNNQEDDTNTSNNNMYNYDKIRPVC